VYERGEGGGLIGSLANWFEEKQAKAVWKIQKIARKETSLIRILEGQLRFFQSEQ